MLINEQEFLEEIAGHLRTITNLKLKIHALEQENETLKKQLSAKYPCVVEWKVKSFEPIEEK